MASLTELVVNSSSVGQCESMASGSHVNHMTLMIVADMLFFNTNYELNVEPQSEEWSDS